MDDQKAPKRKHRDVKPRAAPPDNTAAIRRGGSSDDDIQPRAGAPRENGVDPAKPPVPLPPAPPVRVRTDDGLPQDLRDDGPVRLQLDEVKDEWGETATYKRIAQTLLGLKEQFPKQPPPNTSDPPGARAGDTYFRCLGALARDGRGGKPDPVLASVLMMRAGVAPEQAFGEDSFPAYRRRRREYDEILGDLIPTVFSGSCDLTGYHHCESVCAADDMGVYCARLRRRRQSGVGLRSGIGPLDDALRGLRKTVLVAGTEEANAPLFAVHCVYTALAANPDLAAVVVANHTSHEWVRHSLVAMAAGLRLADYLDGEGPGKATLGRIREEVFRRVAFVKAEGDVGKPSRDAVATKLKTAAENLRAVSGSKRVVFLVESLDALSLALSPQSDDDEDAAGLDRERIGLLSDLARVTADEHSPDGGVAIGVTKLRKGDPARGVGLDDVYGGRDIVHHANTVLLLETTSNRENGTGAFPVLLRVAKTDAVGTRCAISLNYQPVGLRYAPAETSSQPHTRGPSRPKENKS